MRIFLTAAAIGILLTATGAGQERRVPDDSTRLTLVGCAHDRAFITNTPASRQETANVDIGIGRRFRMEGPRAVLSEIRKREATMVEITGLVKKADLAGPGGIPLMGGRVRIGGATPRDPVRDPMFNQTVIDVES